MPLWTELDKNMESLQKQRGLLTPRLDYTQEMIHMAAVSFSE